MRCNTNKMITIKDKKIIPLYNPNCNLINPNDLLDFVKGTPILNENKIIIIGIILKDSKTYIKNDFIYGDIFVLEEYKDCEYYNAEITGEIQNDNDFLIKSVSAIIFKEDK